MRISSAISFLFATGIFFLPWVDIHCENNQQKTSSLITQSGYEIATANYSEGSMLKQLKELGNQGGGKAKETDDARIMKNNELKASPILFGFVAFVGLGAILGLILKKVAWKVGVALCAFGALGVLSYQTAEGFPLEQRAKEDAQKKQANMPAPGDPKLTFGYKSGFYLAWLLAAFPLVGVLLVKSTEEKPKKRAFDDDAPGPDNPFLE